MPDSSEKAGGAPTAGGSVDVARRVPFDRIRYANCWEDGRLLIEALRPAPGRRILSIASAGDNSLHLLSRGAEVVAVDLIYAAFPVAVMAVSIIRSRLPGCSGRRPTNMDSTLPPCLC